MQTNGEKTETIEDAALRSFLQDFDLSVEDLNVLFVRKERGGFMRMPGCGARASLYEEFLDIPDELKEKWNTLPENFRFGYMFATLIEREIV